VFEEFCVSLDFMLKFFTTGYEPLPLFQMGIVLACHFALAKTK